MPLLLLLLLLPLLLLLLLLLLPVNKADAEPGTRLPGAFVAPFGAPFCQFPELQKKKCSKTVP